MKYIKILYSLVRINKNVLFNSLKKIDDWIKVLSIALLIYLLIKTITSASMFSLLLKFQLTPDNKYFFHVLNVLLFILLIANIFASFYFSASNHSNKVSLKLQYYPVGELTAVVIGIVIGMIDLFNLIFIPIYTAILFTMGNFNSAGEIIFSIIILLLFILSVNGIIYLLNNLYPLLISSGKMKKIFNYVTIFLIFFLFLSLRQLTIFLNNSENIIIISNLCTYFPSGIFAKYILSGSKYFSVANTITALIYFLVFDILVVALNIFIHKKLKKRRLFQNNTALKPKVFSIPSIIEKYVSNPIIKKDLIYVYRSTRELVNFGMIILFYFYFAYFIFIKGVSSFKIQHNLVMAQSMFLFFQVLFTLKFYSNFFGYDYSGVINYYCKPIGSEFVIKSKTNSYSHLIWFNIIFASIFLFILKIKGVEFLLFINLMLFVFLISKFLGAVLSVYFPKSINFNGLTGANFSFFTILSIMIFSFTILWIGHLLFGQMNDLYKIIFTLVLLGTNGIIIWSDKKLIVLISVLFRKQKGKIISSCS